jgi:hypothetical protein
LEAHNPSYYFLHLLILLPYNIFLGLHFYEALCHITCRTCKKDASEGLNLSRVAIHVDMTPLTGLPSINFFSVLFLLSYSINTTSHNFIYHSTHFSFFFLSRHFLLSLLFFNFLFHFLPSICYKKWLHLPMFLITTPSVPFYKK